MFGLSVEFFKIKFYGINIYGDFMISASHFLLCSIDLTPFKFLGIPVGFNHMTFTTWRPILDYLKRKVFSWKRIFLSFGGRITLIN